MAKTSVDKKYIRDSIQNVQTNEITISEDKLRIKLEKQIGFIKRASGSLGYLSMSVTCFGVLVGTDFKIVFSITPDMWKTVFFIASIAFFIAFLYSGFYAVFKKATVDTIVRDIKTADDNNYIIDGWNRVKSIFNTEKSNTEVEEAKK